MPRPLKQTVVIVAGDGGRRPLKRALELHGAHVLSARSMGDARVIVETTQGVSGVLVAPSLPDGIGADLREELEKRFPAVRVVELTGDDTSTVAALHLPEDPALSPDLHAARYVSDNTGKLAADWVELCRWDPMLPPEIDVPLAEDMLAAMALAMAEPQPLGWGPDPDVERVAERFGEASSSLDIAIGQLVCLRSTLTRVLATEVSGEHLVEVLDRMHMIVDRAVQVVASETADRLQREALVDPLTGLLNRRALERDGRRETGRAARYGHDFSLMVIDLDGLKEVNDNEGHLAGDIRLRLLSSCLLQSLRTSDSAYRIGGDEFVLLLPEMETSGTATVAERIAAHGAPPFSWGAALYGADGSDLESLIGVADGRLYEARRRSRKPTRA
ncbi:MAG: diguanylate cyclase [Actinobacteria bacterium]|nr:diguanylate cyclase [Actinomycetota bacterium]MBV9936420.1 diguanylate cyclase [Actinomycetota bacterium]